MPSSRDQSRYHTSSAETRQLRSGDLPNEATLTISQPGTQWTSATVDTPCEREGNATIRTRLDLGTVDTKPSRWRPGMIVQVPHIVPNLDPKENDVNLCVYTHHVGNVCPKIRKAIIVQIYADKMIVLPIFSSHQRGLARKPEDYKLLAMSVVSQRDLKWTTNSTEEILIVKGGYVNKSKQNSTWEPCTGSHISLTESLPCKYAWPLSDVGALDQTSTDLLLRRYRLAHHTGYKPVAEQEDHFVHERRQDQAKFK